MQLMTLARWLAAKPLKQNGEPKVGRSSISTLEKWRTQLIATSPCIEMDCSERHGSILSLSDTGSSNDNGWHREQ